MYKKIFTFFSLTISFFVLSQNKILFDNRLFYKIANRETIWSVSEINPDIIKIDNITLNLKFIYYNGYLSSYEFDKNNEINYKTLTFQKKETRNFEVISEEKTKIDKFNCIKYTVKSDRRLFEFFISKNKINNTSYLYSILESKKANVFKPGLIVKINMHYESETVFKSFLTLGKIEKIKPKELNYSIDINALNESLKTTEINSKNRKLQTSEIIPNK